MSNLNTILDKLKGDAYKEVRKDLKKLLKDGKADSVAFVKENAASVQRWLEYRASGDLTKDEVKSLLKSQKKIAQIFVNTQKIKARARTQKLVYRLLDLAIDVIIALL